jgi:BirA family transcriptional regulator, biotin operon repressor / biotin---[acetyl-CoA-carboxylase] ligase
LRKLVLKYKLLELLCREKGNFVSSKILNEKFNVTRTTIWKNIKELKKSGYLIESSSKKGYKLLDYQDKIIPYEIIDGLETTIIGKEIIYYDEIDSTNDDSKRQAQNGFIDGGVVVADKQTRGKGRLGRTWDSIPCKGIWMSILLRPSIAPEEIQKITLAASVAVVKAFDKCFNIKAGIKWPNDILLDGRKVCGILTEMSAEVDRINYVVVGIGINVKHKKDDFAKVIIDSAISLEGYLERNNNYENLNRNVIIKNILIEFEKVYLGILNGKTGYIIDMWKKYSVTLNRDIKIIGINCEYIGKAIDITNEGKIVVKLTDGNIKEFISGEISIR